MKKRRIISFIVSMAMLVSSMAALHVTAEDAETAKQTILPADWHFMDIARNGDTVVAMAKSATTKYMRPLRRWSGLRSGLCLHMHRK